MKSVALSAAASSALKNLLKGIGKPALITTVFIAVLTLVPFNIALPQSIVDMLSKGSISKVFNLIYYFFPVDFALKCLLVIFLSNYVSLLWGMVNFIFSKLLSFFDTRS